MLITMPTTVTSRTTVSAVRTMRSMWCRATLSPRTTANSSSNETANRAVLNRTAAARTTASSTAMSQMCSRVTMRMFPKR